MAEGKYLTVGEVKTLLEKEKKKRELSPEQKIALEHAKQFTKLDYRKIKKLRDELEKCEFVSSANAARIADILPTHPDDVKIIFTKARFTLESENIEQILETVRKYL
jgi:DNA-directed RNA polymerase subunit F